MEYQEFLESKIMDVSNTGFDYKDFHKNTFEHQKDVCRWALNGGRRAVFCSFGLGKTIIQLEIATAVINHTNKPFLIGLPLGVLGEFKDDAKNILGLEIHYVTDQEDMGHCQSYYPTPQIFVSNYDRIREAYFDMSYFGGISFDEGDAIRNRETKTTEYIITEASKVPYRFIATATPSPNEYTELLNYAEFLGVCDRGQALTRFFKRNSTSAGNLTLYEHKESEFWLWVRSWAIFIEYPSDLGYSDEGYLLPELKMHYHEISVKDRQHKVDRDGNYKMFTDASKSLSAAAKEKRESLYLRVEASVEIAKTQPDAHFIFWHDLEDERKLLETLLPKDNTKSVFGSQSHEIKEQYLNEFKHGQYQYLATKPSIAGSGCNFQKHCSNAVFTGIGYKFKDFIQAVHRILRFRQKSEVNIHLVYTDAEVEILKRLEQKWANHKEMVEKMTTLMKKYGLNHKAQIEELKRTIAIERKECRSENVLSVKTDAVEEVRKMPDNSIQMVLTSIPFSDQYEYCENYRDFGHNNGNDGFFKQMDYLIPELLRVLEPGRIAAIHVKNRIVFSYQNGVGFTTLGRFRSYTEEAFCKHGFWYLGEHYIETDVVRENGQTYRLGWTENCKDGTKMGAGSPEYLLIFRKAPTDTSNAYADTKVEKSKANYSRGRWQLDAHSKWRSSGNRLLTSDELRTMSLKQIGKHWKQYAKNNVYDFEKHVNLCEDLDKLGKLPASFMAVAPHSFLGNDFVWDDVNRMNTLNTIQASKKKMLHVCPLQFDIVDRAIERYSNKGDVVYDPFSGIGTTGVRCIKKERKAILTELNDVYWNDGIEYIKAEEYKKTIPTLFDVLEMEKTA